MDRTNNNIKCNANMYVAEIKNQRTIIVYHKRVVDVIAIQHSDSLKAFGVIPIIGTFIKITLWHVTPPFY